MHNFIFEYFTKRRKKNATKELICIRKKPKIYIPQKFKITKKLSEISKNKLVSTHPENSAHELKFPTSHMPVGWGALSFLLTVPTFNPISFVSI